MNNYDYIHPDKQWIYDVMRHIASDPYWLNDNLDDVVNALPHYLRSADYVLMVLGLANMCVEELFPKRHYAKIIDLCETATNTVTEHWDNLDLSVMPQDLVIRIDGTSVINEEDNTLDYEREYFTVKLNLASAYLKLHHPLKAKRVIDDILHVLDNAIDADRLEAYYVLLRSYKYGYEFELDFDLIQAATKLTIGKYTNRKTDLLTAIADYHYAQGNNAEIRDMYQEFTRQMGKDIQASRITRIKAAEYVAEQNFYLAVIYREQGKFAEAREYLEKSGEHYLEIGNPKRDIHIAIEIALCHTLEFYTEPINTAHTIAQQLVDNAYRDYGALSTDEQESVTLAHIHHTQGLIYLHTEQYSKAIDIFSSSLKIWQHHQNSYHIALTCNAIGYTYSQMHNYDVALERYRRAEVNCIGLPAQHAKQLLAVIRGNIKNAQDHLKP